MTIRVGVPLVAGKIEKLVAEMLGKALDKEHEAGQDWLPTVTPGLAASYAPLAEVVRASTSPPRGRPPAAPAGWCATWCTTCTPTPSGPWWPSTPPRDGPADCDDVHYWAAWGSDPDTDERVRRWTRVEAGLFSWEGLRDRYAEAAAAAVRAMEAADPTAVVITAQHAHGRGPGEHPRGRGDAAPPRPGGRAGRAGPGARRWRRYAAWSSGLLDPRRPSPAGPTSGWSWWGPAARRRPGRAPRPRRGGRTRLHLSRGRTVVVGVVVLAAAPPDDTARSTNGPNASRSVSACSKGCSDPM